MKLAELVELSDDLSRTSGRKGKIDRLAGFLGRVPPHEVPLAVSFLIGQTRHGRLGVGPALLNAALQGAIPAGRAVLTLSELDRRCGELRLLSGSGSTVRRKQLLGRLFTQATVAERLFLARLLLGELRQGALEGVMSEAVAAAAGLSVSQVRRAAMVAGELPVVAGAALAGGVDGLGRFRLQPMHPISPMLAQTARDLPDVFQRLGRAALEYKIDGARVQVHKAGESVKVFSRQLNEVSGAVPEIIEAVRCLPDEALILDGEAVALRADGLPHPFQITMRRFGRTLDIDRLRQRLPLRSWFFDLLHRSGEDLIDRPGEMRFAALAESLPRPLLIPRRVTARAREAKVFLRESLAHGHEGIMAKALDAPYAAGNRGGSWLKFKPFHTLDLVVIAGEWGHGRRSRWLSNLHLGARDEATGGYAMLGKTFKGMTDRMLQWQTGRLLDLAVAREGRVVYVRPALVVEIAFNDVQESPRYPAGLALRFARVRRYRPDKRVEQADSLEAVRAIFHRQGRGPIEALPRNG